MPTRGSLRKSPAIAGAVAILVLVSACSHGSGHDSATGSTPASTPVASSSTGVTSAAPSSTATPASTGSGSGGKSGSPATAVIPSVAVSTKAPVSFSEPGDFGGGVTVKVVKTADQTSTDTGPGSIQGQAVVAFTLEFTNRSSQPLPVNTVNVTATYGKAQTPASPANASTDTPLSGTIKPGASATGVYAFAIPKSARADVSLQLWYAQGKPVVVFAGTVS